MANEREAPKWGDPIERILESRRKELMRLHDEQVKWATRGQGNYKQSPLATASTTLTGLEVFFLAAYALAGQDGDIEASADRLRVRGPEVAKSGNLSVVGGARITLEALHLEGMSAIVAHLQHAQLSGAHLEGAYLTEVHFEDAMLNGARLAHANLLFGHLENAHLSEAHLEGAELFMAHLNNAILNDARLEGANLLDAHLERAQLMSAHLEGANLQNAHLEGANLWGAFFSISTNLINVAVSADSDGMPSIANVRWQGVNLTEIKWPEHPILGDERLARTIETQMLQSRSDDMHAIQMKELTAGQRETVQRSWRSAARTYRQVASIMRDQGMNDEADRFAYRGNICQRRLYRLQGSYLRQFGSWFLDLVSGYGYRPLRSGIAYAVVIFAFMGLYLLNARFAAPHLTWDEALVLSISSFHGRGFFANNITLGNNLARLAAGEAIIGLLLEITFIATFTQRFFAR